MTFETIDWEAEAQRLALAFEIDTRCVFRPFTYHESEIKGMHFWPEWRNKYALLSCGNHFSASYNSEYKTYSCHRNENDWEALHLTFSWNDDFMGSQVVRQSPLSFARGFVRLNLFTPEIELILQAPISAHDKLELRLQYQERLMNL